MKVGESVSIRPLLRYLLLVTGWVGALDADHTSQDTDTHQIHCADSDSILWPVEGASSNKEGGDRHDDAEY